MTREHPTSPIPKVLHYVWLGSKKMHPLMKEWQQKWASLHPGWTVKVWQQTNDLPEHMLTCKNEIVECRHRDFLRQCPTFSKRSDVWRYDILEQLGGIYLDTDMEPVKCIEPLIGDAQAFAGLCDTKYGWTPANPAGKHKTEVGCSIMGCTPHHPWAVDLVERVPYQDPVEQLSLAFPFLTNVTAKHPDVVLFKTDIFYPVSWDKYAQGGRHSLRREPIPDTTYAVHRWSSCWFTDSLKKLDTTT